MFIDSEFDIARTSVQKAIGRFLQNAIWGSPCQDPENPDHYDQRNIFEECRISGELRLNVFSLSIVLVIVCSP